jgi:uncharacterized OsmC-like protein
VVAGKFAKPGAGCANVPQLRAFHAPNPEAPGQLNADELRHLQAPLKARYKEDPKAALVTLRSVGRVEQSTLTCALETGKPGLPAGPHPAVGGGGSAACPGDMLLEALVACAGVTLASVATAMGIVLKHAKVAAEGDLDFRGTLGVSRDAPVGFTSIRCTFEIEAEAPPEKIQKLVELSERYCAILQTLRHSPALTVELTTL